MRRREGRERVPRRPGARGARRARAPDHGRGRWPDPAGTDQRQAGRGGGDGVLRVVAAVAVHGPEQHAVGSNPPAPTLRAWPGRPDPRAPRLGTPRRAPDPFTTPLHASPPRT